MPRSSARPVGSWGAWWAALAVLTAALAPVPAPGQVTPDQAAAALLNSARKAHNDKNYPFAVARFREFIARFGNHKDAPAAHYGLALALIELPERDYAGAVQELQPLAGNGAFADRPFALYYLGLAQRGLGMRELAQAAARPAETAQRQAAARPRFEEAGRQFAAAVPLLTARGKDPGPAARELPADLEWAARARCDLAEMQLRTDKPKDAQATAAAFLKDHPWAKSRYRGLGRYYHGFASFVLKDYAAAAAALDPLAPFADPVVGSHARYLVARLRHLEGKQAEAAAGYDAVVADHVRRKQEAAATLARPDAGKLDPAERERLDLLAKGPPPEHVARAAFFADTLVYDQGRFADALARFIAFPKDYAGSLLLPDAQLHAGACQVRLKQYPAALQNLQPLADREARLTDQALFWVGRAQVGAADPANAPAHEQALRTAIETFRRSADRAAQLAGQDPGARARRGAALLELADTQQQIKQYREAANTYAQVFNEKLSPNRDEELLHRQATALQLAGDYAGSDQVCLRFQQAYPKSTLLPAVLFRHAENAYFPAAAAARNPSLPNRAELARLFDEAGKRYQVIVDRFPNSPQVWYARYGLAMAAYHKGQVDQARQMLEAIPAAQRTGELVVVSYALADCRLRLPPAQGGDVRAAVDLLDTCLAAQPAGPHAADALVKLGYCHQRLAEQAADAKAMGKALGDARGAYERLLQQFPTHELRPLATFERARCLARMGDVNGAVAELQRFQADPLKAARVAPLALLELATLLRGQKRPADAAAVLTQCRQQQEPTLLGDQTRVDWVPLLRYHEGMALQEAAKLPEARAVFDLVVKQTPNRPEAAAAALHYAQCLRAEGEPKVVAAHKMPTAKPEEVAAAARTLEEGLRPVREAAQLLETQANALKATKPAGEVRARVLYELAWDCRMIAEPEVTAARTKLQQERLQKLQAEAAKRQPPPNPAEVIAPPEVPLKDVPPQPSELKARAQYEALIADFPKLPLATDARFELAELLADREDYDGALKLLTEGLARDPPAELAAKLRLRLGACYAAKGDAASALAQLDRVAKDDTGVLGGQAHYRAGEVLARSGQWAKAATRFAVFRDQPALQNLPGLSDRALLRLGQALAEAGQWEPSRQAYETLLARFPTSPWANEARYGVGWAWQNQKNYDNAVAAYLPVVNGALTETAAKAQLQIGLCRLEQKRYAEASTALLAVPYTYDFPELNGVALCEAARALAEQKQSEQAVRLLRRVLRDHPGSKWAEVAQERLQSLGG